MDGNRPKDNERPDKWLGFFGRDKSDDTSKEAPEGQTEKDTKRTEQAPEAKETKKQQPDTQSDKKHEKRKIKRRQVIHRSRARLEEAEARDPYQTFQYSPIERVQLAVARQIVSLDTRLQTDESLDDEDIASLEHSIDFMGLMADKLLNPELDTAPEVEAAVAILLEPLLEPSPDAAPMSSPAMQQRTLNADMKDMGVAIASTTPVMIQKWLDDEPAALVGATQSDNPVEKPEAKTEPTYKFTRIDPEQILETANDYRRMVPTVMRVLKKERKKKQAIVMPGAASAGATGVASPAALTTPDEVEQNEPKGRPFSTIHKHSGLGSAKAQDVQSSPPPVIIPSLAAEHSLEPLPKSSPSKQQPAQKPEHPVQTTHEQHTERLVPEIKLHKKVEHMSIHELLQEAENIPVGNGQYLKRAYETGEIDQKGLADVIKSYHKGRDFKREFSAKRAAYRYQRANTLEMGQEPHEASMTPDDTKSPMRNDSDDTNSPTADVKQVQPSTNSTPAASPATQPAVEKAPNDDRAALLGSILEGNPTQSKDSFVKQAAAVVAAGSGVALIGWLLFSIF